MKVIAKRPEAESLAERSQEQKSAAFDFALACREKTKRALEVLEEIMTNKRAPASARIKAAQTVVERAYGRTPEHVEITAHMDDEQLANAAEAILRARRGEQHAITMPAVDVEWVDQGDGIEADWVDPPTPPCPVDPPRGVEIGTPQTKPPVSNNKLLTSTDSIEEPPYSIEEPQEETLDEDS